MLARAQANVGWRHLILDREQRTLRFAREVQTMGKEKSPYLVAITGMVSPRLRQELEARRFRVEERVVSGPLK